MTVPEAADRFGLSEESIRRWIRQGDLPAARSGRAYALQERDVRMAMALRRRRGRPSHVHISRRIRWQRRLHGPSSTLPLGFASEIWLDTGELPGYAAFVEATSDLEHHPHFGWQLTNHLLPDVVEAAGASSLLA